MIWRKRIADWMFLLINDKAVCRTAPATLGLVIVLAASSFIWGEIFPIYPEGGVPEVPLISSLSWEGETSTTNRQQYTTKKPEKLRYMAACGRLTKGTLLKCSIVVDIVDMKLYCQNPSNCRILIPSPWNCFLRAQLKRFNIPYESKTIFISHF